MVQRRAHGGRAVRPVPPRAEGGGVYRGGQQRQKFGAVAGEAGFRVVGVRKNQAIEGGRVH